MVAHRVGELVHAALMARRASSLNIIIFAIIHCLLGWLNSLVPHTHLPLWGRACPEPVEGPGRGLLR